MIPTSQRQQRGCPARMRRRLSVRRWRGRKKAVRLEGMAQSFRTASTPPGFLTLVSGPAVSIVSLGGVPAAQIAEDRGNTLRRHWRFRGISGSSPSSSSSLGRSDRHGRRPILLTVLSLFLLRPSVVHWRRASKPVGVARCRCRHRCWYGFICGCARLPQVEVPPAASARWASFGRRPVIGPVGGLLDQALDDGVLVARPSGRGAPGVADFGDNAKERDRSAARGYPAAVRSPFWSCAPVMVFGVGCSTCFSGYALWLGVFDLEPAAVGMLVSSRRVFCG